MEAKQFRQIEGWFKKMNQRFDDTNRRIENRYTALLAACTNIRKDLEHVRNDLKESRDKYEARITTIELAVQELENRLSH